MPEISTKDFVLFFIFVIFAVVDMNYEFIGFKIFLIDYNEYFVFFLRRYALSEFLPAH